MGDNVVVRIQGCSHPSGSADSIVARFSLSTIAYLVHALVFWSSYDIHFTRPQSHKIIHLMWNFNEQIFTRHLLDELRDKDEMLELLTAETKDKYDLGLYDFE